MGCSIVAPITAIAALAVVAANSFVLYGAKWSTFPIIDAIGFALLRGYCIVFALTAVMVETGWERLKKQIRVVFYWVPRGMFYVFIGTLSLSTGHQKAADDSEDELKFEWKRNALQISGFVMAGIGCMYIIGGVMYPGRSSGETDEDDEEMLAEERELRKERRRKERQLERSRERDTAGAPENGTTRVERERENVRRERERRERERQLDQPPSFRRQEQPPVSAVEPFRAHLGSALDEEQGGAREYNYR
eukprot:TRINITY_DN60162_c0_g1_i1.p2 TRINITY_DN60162_c0_g1~~TRINITY_DN60162_c0_g1_i1.p2  ORF type:complete len:257 (-),score=14.46 TRINITY_DN60162_c0_g1_i1:1254-2000(-)